MGRTNCIHPVSRRQGIRRPGAGVGQAEPNPILVRQNLTPLSSAGPGLALPTRREGFEVAASVEKASDDLPDVEGVRLIEPTLVLHSGTAVGDPIPIQEKPLHRADDTALIRPGDRVVPNLEDLPHGYPRLRGKVGRAREPTKSTRQGILPPLPDPALEIEPQPCLAAGDQEEVDLNVQLVRHRLKCVFDFTGSHRPKPALLANPLGCGKEPGLEVVLSFPGSERILKDLDRSGTCQRGRPSPAQKINSPIARQNESSSRSSVVHPASLGESRATCQ